MEMEVNAERYQRCGRTLSIWSNTFHMRMSKFVPSLLNLVHLAFHPAEIFQRNVLKSPACNIPFESVNIFANPMLLSKNLCYRRLCSHLTSVSERRHVLLDTRLRKVFSLQWRRLKAISGLGGFVKLARWLALDDDDMSSLLAQR